MNPAQRRALLDDMGVLLLDDHYVCASGMHVTSYVNKDALFLHPPTLALLCAEAVAAMHWSGIEAVVGASVGGAIVAQHTAAALEVVSRGRRVIAAYADKQPDGTLKFLRGYDAAIRRKRTLIVEDVAHTGGTIQRLHRATQECGAVVVGTVALITRARRNGVAGSGVATAAVVSLADDPRFQQVWTAEECAKSGPCSRGIPVRTDMGHGQRFLDRIAADAAINYGGCA